MKRLFLSVLLICSTNLRADELLKSAQSELKELGFFYQEVTGVNSPETVAAIKRYQIRNGLEVTGSLTRETLQALGLESGGAAAPAPAKPAPAPAPAPPSAAPKQNPPVHLRREESLDESDRDFLQREAANPGSASDPSTVAPPAPLNPPPTPGSEEYTAIFSGTPFESAPAEVQFNTLRKAQNILRRSGYYREAVDGQPGPDTEEALLRYQSGRRLPLSGRLDLRTLDAMSLLPGRRDGPPVQPFKVPPGSRSSTRTLRGVWVY